MSINIHDKDFDIDEAAEYLISEIEKCSKDNQDNNAKIKLEESEC